MSNIWSYPLHKKCQKTLWTLIKGSLRSVMFDNTRRNRQKSFHHWKDCLFFETFCFQQPPRSQKSSYNYHTDCQIFLWTLINCSLLFVTLDDMRKNRLNFFVTVKTASISNDFFYRHPRSQRSDLIIWTLNTNYENTLWTLISCFWTLDKFGKKKKTGQNLFFTGKFASFSKLCDFNNISGPE